MAALVESVIAGGLGGFLSGFGIRWAWEKYTAANLKLSILTAERHYDVEPTEQSPEIVLFQFTVENVGKSAAKNCRVHLFLRGEDSEKTYYLNTPLCWSISKSPQNVDINRGESLRFDLVKLKMDDNTYRFPSEQGWENNRRMIVKEDDSKPVAHQYETNTPGVVNTSGLQDVVFETIDWKKSYIEITSKDSQPVRYDLNFEFENHTDSNIPSPHIIAVPV